LARTFAFFGFFIAVHDYGVVTLRFNTDPETGLPHIQSHGVREDEVREVLRKPFEEFRGRGDSYVAHGQTLDGRFLKVVYCRDEIGDGIYVITAYDLSSRQLHALRRRLRKKSR
jgi:hypothetical protein